MERCGKAEAEADDDQDGQNNQWLVGVPFNEEQECGATCEQG
jgi:hypothetical protein